MSSMTLRNRIAGEVVVPGDGGYEQLRTVFSRQGEPAVVVRPKCNDDIRHTLEYVRNEGLVLSVRSGGHGGPGFGTNDGGVVLDLSRFDAVEVLDPNLHLVRVGTGATWLDVARTLAPHGLAISSGDTASVGVGGLILGGGIGWMVRRYGLTIDSLVAAEVVLADGRGVRTSSDEHPELFWALRGGGGSFGVVTSFDLVAQPVRDVLFGTVSYPASQAPTVLRRWRDAMRVAPDDVTSTVQLMPSPPGAPDLVTVGVCVPTDAPSPAAAVEPLLTLGDAVGQDIGRRPYAGVLEEPPPLPTGLRPTVRNVLTPELGDNVIDLVTDGVGTLGAAVAQFRSLGGLVARVDSDATAFAHRDSEALVVVVLLNQAPEARAAFAELHRSLAPSASGSYGNLMSTTEADDVRAVYPPRTYARLLSVKRAYDPDNVFSQNYNVAANSGAR